MWNSARDGKSNGMRSRSPIQNRRDDLMLNAGILGVGLELKGDSLQCRLVPVKVSSTAREAGRQKRTGRTILTDTPSLSMRNVKLTLSYDGTDFHGWQALANLYAPFKNFSKTPSTTLTGTRPATNASGRTDAGVHALGQVVHFLTISRHSNDTFVRALNAILPHDIRVLAAEEKPQAFLARRRSTLKSKRLSLRDR